ncbi:MAG: thymidine phosphorylase [Bacteroidales bacterium]
MRVVDIIRKKRDGESLTREEIEQVVAGTVDGTIPDYQLSALLMATVLRGMDEQETAWLTTAMARSGERLDLSDIAGPKVDKHSTGGVGDKTSLVLAPVAAACGAVVPMMSGRGLGHTGGTLDKLESIPGFSVNLDEKRLREALSSVGCVVIGQTAALAPADRKLYALRDVTATVESLPLITASIMSKKIAEGIEGLVLDVKAGSGAFMKTTTAARELARAMVSVGQRAGVRTEALVTSMDAPLGRAVGNALEVIECLDTLEGHGPRDVEELSLALAARMLLVGGIASDPEDAASRVRRALHSGAALDTFRRMVAFQGGDLRALDDRRLLPTAERVTTVRAERSGVVVAVDAEAIGRATVLLGAGRDAVGAPVDPAVGAIVRGRPGDRVAAGDALVDLHVRRDDRLHEACALVSAAFRIEPGVLSHPFESSPLIIDVIC